MNLRKILTATLALTFVPCSLLLQAAKPSKKSTVRKARIHKPAAKKTRTTLSLATALPKAESDKVENAEDVSGETIVKTAMRYIGVPYRLGTSSPKSFDCSGFTSYVFKQYDIKLSRSSRTQYAEGKVIKNKADLRAGDLVFFRGRSGKGGVGHVGIVTAVSPKDKTFTFVHASCSKGIAVEKSTTAYYNSRYVGARRVLRTDTVK